MPVAPAEPKFEGLDFDKSMLGGRGGATTLKSGIMGFSGCDISATIRVPAYSRMGISGSQDLNAEKVFRIGTLQTISISTYNSKTPVKALGFKNPIAIARGGRTIAGTMIFNQLHRHVLDENDYGYWKVQEDKGGMLTYSSGNADYYIKNADANDKLKRDMELISGSGDLALYIAKRGQIDGTMQAIEDESRVVTAEYSSKKVPTDEEKAKYQADQQKILQRIKDVDVMRDEEYIKLGNQYSYYHEMRKILEKSLQNKEYARKEWDFSWDGPQIGDQLKPSDILPFDIIILLLNEAGNMGKIILYGVEIVHDSQTLSVEDIYTEVQYQYIARDIVYFEDLYAEGTIYNFTNARGRKIQTPSMKVYDTRNSSGSETPPPAITSAAKEAELEATLAAARTAPIPSNLNAAEKLAAEEARAKHLKELEDKRQELGNAREKARQDNLEREAAILNDVASGGRFVRPEGATSTKTQIRPTDYKTNAEYKKAVAEQEIADRKNYEAQTDKKMAESDQAFQELLKEFGVFDK